MNIKNFALFALFMICGMVSFAQETIRGEVVDKVNGDPVYNATIKVNGVGKAKTDFDGAFVLKLVPGSYEISITNNAEGYVEEKRKLDVVAGNVINFTVELGKTKEVQISEVKVVAAKTGGNAPTSVKASDKRRMDESAASDELPKETIKNSGVTSAADAVQMVPSASVEDGKNVYIRGLGDRYTKTILNGMDIPGLDPDRNSVQMDIFPAVLIDNITVYKTFTPNLSGDFTGGLVNIATKDFPARKTIYVKAGLGYNTNASFNKDYISYEGGALDFLGFDDGTRKLGIHPEKVIPHPVQNDSYTETATRSFSNIMSTQKANAFLNQSYSFAIGNQINKPRKKDSLQNMTYGYNAVLNYRNSHTFYKDVQYNEFIRDQDFSVNELFRDRSASGEQSQHDVMWTALLGQSIKVNRNKISLVLFHTQNGTSSAANLTETNFDSNQATLVRQGLQYTQRSVSNANISGIHFLDSASRWKMTWKLSPTFSRISDPDIRSTSLEVSDVPGPNGETQYLWQESVGAEVRRIFRSLNEYNIGGRVDLAYTFKPWKNAKMKDGKSKEWLEDRKNLKSELSFGLLHTYKSRDFDVSEYVFKLYNTSNVVPNDPDWFFQDENIYSAQTGQGTYVTGQQEQANIYQANQNISGAYVMNELPLSKKFNITYGARLENNVNRYTGESNNAATDPNAPRYNNEVVLSKMNVLPSVNMVYKLRKKGDSTRLDRSTNFRGAYTQTVARPSFREISISQIYDPIQGRRYLGNIDLKQTLIHNADIRWEYFFGRTELISASAFYKKFINPIEVVANVAAPNEFKPVNAGEADVYGAEFEVRKAIGFNKPGKEHISWIIGGNFTYVLSRIDMRKVETQIGGQTFTEKEVRENNARVGETIGNYRSMYGQSPYIVNAFTTFRNDSLGLMLNLTYNVQGKKLAVIGVGAVPDVYEQPFHSLNMKVSKTFGKIHEGESAPRWKASLRATNLLNFAKRKFYEAYQAESQIFDYFHQGVTVSGSVTFTIR